MLEEVRTQQSSLMNEIKTATRTNTRQCGKYGARYIRLNYSRRSFLTLEINAKER